MSDTGRGIPEAIKCRLFKEEVASADVRGVGLGLMSCRVFAEAIGGRCWLQETSTRSLESPEATSGSEFRFSLPGSVVEPSQKHFHDDGTFAARETAVVDYSPKAEDAQCLPESLRVFVVEDSTMLRRVVIAKLKTVSKLTKVLFHFTEHETVESLLPTLDSFLEDPSAVVTIDENLDSMGGTLKGSFLVAALKRANFKGLIVSCSDDDDAAADHLKKGADIVWGKPFPNTQVILASLQRFYQSHHQSTKNN